MRLGVSYNIFDGEELLEASIRQIRPCVDHINIVYQLISNYGNQADKDLEKTLVNLKEKGLVESLYKYEPNLQKRGYYNERTKRTIGLSIARKSKCTHFLSMDADEFYIQSEFKNAKNFIINKNIDASAVFIREYVKYPTCRKTCFETNFVPFICRIRTFTKCKNDKNFPVYTDASRKIKPWKKFWLFPYNEIYMHHMATIRKNLDIKYKNSSHNDNKDFIKYIDNKLKNLENFTPKDIYRDSRTEIVENIFNINIK
jgi:hypothetical protein